MTKNIVRDDHVFEMGHVKARNTLVPLAVVILFFIGLFVVMNPEILNEYRDMREGFDRIKTLFQEELPGLGTIYWAFIALPVVVVLIVFIRSWLPISYVRIDKSSILVKTGFEYLLNRSGTRHQIKQLRWLKTRQRSGKNHHDVIEMKVTDHLNNVHELTLSDNSFGIYSIVRMEEWLREQFPRRVDKVIRGQKERMIKN